MAAAFGLEEISYEMTFSFVHICVRYDMTK